MYIKYIHIIIICICMYVRTYTYVCKYIIQLLQHLLHVNVHITMYMHVCNYIHVSRVSNNVTKIKINFELHSKDCNKKKRNE